MQRDKAYLLDILEAAKLVMSYVAKKNKEDFIKDIQCQDAVIRRLEIIGEATNNLSQEFRTKHTDIPWRDAIDMRNFLIHEYFGVRTRVVWDTCQEDLPLMKRLISNLVDN